MHGVYIVWFLLPLALLLLTGWALLKPVFGVSGKEYAGEYFKQAAFCLVTFFIAVGLDRPYIDDIAAVLTGSTDAGTILHWILYPLVLFLFAYLHKVYLKMTGKDPKTHLNDGLARYKR